MTSKANVLLLRESTPSSDSGQDRYEAIFTAANYTPFLIPVLETVLTNINELASVTAQGNFDGVVMTSARSCEAWYQANGAAKNECPFYVVGKATASTLRCTIPNADIRGECSGTAEQLANFILAERPRPTKLLCLTGDKNRDTLSSILGAAGVSLYSLKVYETQGSSTFSQCLKEIVPERPTTPWWIVFFAPSAAEFVLSFVKEGFDLDLVKIAAIGPTTGTFLRETVKLRVDAVPAKPSPEELVRVIVSVDGAP
ncbi:tetrapyrrole biosynthesis, uroporphyrinogen III synthase [Guyanagaster necrorhizus]|uniref:Tetrapyrrole biosynthesis, uroporphyrinogen III synthase n=1 Tax=Guyanagaster necrorhizus TaxID=856835 RepID=A0A9P7VTC1_9AGAR|nr:tetrapyrrole biosynthesis, uroporphyrinogen III synthase [Guyanagaster necrorhizus MCA 3950]KAG7447043.1 tetrapyrrole biosynthesis, uroporphyrinogen III synthase [Guyanagaster necrorhizus MCA 3950]